MCLDRKSEFYPLFYFFPFLCAYEQFPFNQPLAECFACTLTKCYTEIDVRQERHTEKTHTCGVPTNSALPWWKISVEMSEACNPIGQRQTIHLKHHLGSPLGSGNISCNCSFSFYIAPLLQAYACDGVNIMSMCWKLLQDTPSFFPNLYTCFQFFST